MQAHCQKHIKFHYFSHSKHTLLRFYILITDKTTIKVQEKRKHQNFNNKYALKKTIILFMVFFLKQKIYYLFKILHLYKSVFAEFINLVAHF